MVQDEYEWTVVGAGPAGISAIAVLLSHHQTNILWLDPTFTSGYLKNVPQVPSNTTIESLERQFFNACENFGYEDMTDLKLPSQPYCTISHVSALCTRITTRLLPRVHHQKAKMTKLEIHDKSWRLTISTSSNTYLSHRVILATGCSPITPTLGFSTSLSVVAIETALNVSTMAVVTPRPSRVAVFGSSHSAIVVMMNLAELKIPVVNVYRSKEILFAAETPNGNINWFTGLKGAASEWVLKNILEEPHMNLVRSHLDHAEDAIKDCSHVVYAVGYAPTALNVVGVDKLKNDNTGRIAERLYGVGFGWPRIGTDLLGKVEPEIGLSYFLDVLQENVPDWLLD